MVGVKRFDSGDVSMWDCCVDSMGCVCVEVMCGV